MKASRLARWAGRVLLAIGVLAAGSAYAQGGTAAPETPSSVLYNQNQPADVSAAGWSSSSNFEAALSTFDSQAADDFLISHQFWHITSITVPGLYDGPAGSTYVNSLLVQFYADAGTSPARPAANPIASQTIPAGSIGGLTSGWFVVNLNPSVTLGPGHYWLSVQANKSFGSDSRQWAWREYTVQSNSESVWQQPGNGYGKGCLTWKPRVTVCHEPATNSQGKDLAFELDGTSNPVTHQVFLPVARR